MAGLHFATDRGPQPEVGLLAQMDLLYALESEPEGHDASSPGELSIGMVARAKSASIRRSMFGNLRILG
jgi:hypothetical protein